MQKALLRWIVSLKEIYNKIKMRGDKSMNSVVVSILLAYGTSTVEARKNYHDPVEYRLALQETLKDNNITNYCKELNDETPEELSSWNWTLHCSIASTNFTFYNEETEQFQKAVEGEVIPFTCSDLFCPPRQVEDCYGNPGICSEDEWCQIDIQERWAPWGAGKDGNTIIEDADFCKNPLYYNSTDEDVMKTYQIFCESQETFLASNPIRGRCVSYRLKEQSCESTFGNEFSSSLYDVPEDGKNFERPLRCKPSLACTGDNFYVTRNTCVDSRPANVCYQGPWWNSTDCPRSEEGALSGGLTREQAITSMASFMLLYGGEKAILGGCPFWYNETAIGKERLTIQKAAYTIISTLWPGHIYGEVPTYEEMVENVLPAPQNYGTLDQCLDDFSNMTSPTRTELLKARTFLRPTRIWSAIHNSVHNIKDGIMTPAQVDASRAIAILLQQNFWCTDCRGFFAIGILAEYGYPPNTNNAKDHQEYWNLGHNVASEHTASTRGGHPWLNTVGNKYVAKYGGTKPFYMPLKTAIEMWTIPQDYKPQN